MPAKAEPSNDEAARIPKAFMMAITSLVRQAETKNGLRNELSDQKTTVITGIHATVALVVVVGIVWWLSVGGEERDGDGRWLGEVMRQVRVSDGRQVEAVAGVSELCLSATLVFLGRSYRWTKQATNKYVGCGYCEW
jgi:hypothetical protein